MEVYLNKCVKMAIKRLKSRNDGRQLKYLSRKPYQQALSYVEENEGWKFELKLVIRSV
jgi:hypothetical protein